MNRELNRFEDLIQPGGNKWVSIGDVCNSYTIGRAQLIKELSVEFIMLLHRHENKNQYLCPPFQIRFLLSKQLENFNFTELTETEKHNWLSAIWKLKSKEEDIESDEYYKNNLQINPIVDFYHAWDWNIKNELPTF